MVELERLEIKYASSGFHVYKDIWKPTLSQLLEIFHEQRNVYDPFAMAFKVKSAAMLTKSVIGHIPRDISRFCWYFMDYGGLLEALVRDTVCTISPILKSWETRKAYSCEKRRFNEERGGGVAMFWQKILCSVITNSSNWEILPKKLVTLKK